MHLHGNITSFDKKGQEAVTKLFSHLQDAHNHMAQVAQAVVKLSKVSSPEQFTFVLQLAVRPIIQLKIPPHLCCVAPMWLSSINPFIEFRIRKNSSSSDVLYIPARISISPMYESKMHVHGNITSFDKKGQEAVTKLFSHLQDAHNHMAQVAQAVVQLSKVSSPEQFTFVLQLAVRPIIQLKIPPHLCCVAPMWLSSLNPFIEFRIRNNSSSSDVLYIQARISISPMYESK